MAQNLTPEDTKEKLTRALRAKAVLTERSRRLFQQLEDFRNREHSQDHVTSELLERQRELNYMLHRASSVLHQLQDTNLALSAEFTHIVKELPAPNESSWDETISRVEDLFQKTHELAGEMQEEIFRATSEPVIPKMKTEEARTQATEQVAVAEVQSPPVEEDHRPPADAHEAEFRPSDEPDASPSPSPKRRARTAVPKAKPPKEESPDDIFSRLDAYEAEKSPNNSRKPRFLERILAWLNREA